MNIRLVEKKVIIIDDVECPVLQEFEVLQAGWELDDMAFIIEYNGENRLIWSNHGSTILVSNDVSDFPQNKGKRIDIDLLEGFIRRYENSVNSTTQALNLLLNINN